MKIILASKSPRRNDLLKLLKVDFEIICSNQEEKIEGNEKFFEIPKKLALQKAENVLGRTKEFGDRIIIGSDTVVALDGKIFGKPKTKEDACNMLMKLSDNTHEVITGLAILVVENKEIRRYLFSDTAKVTFKKLTPKDIEYYIGTGEPMDKAGAYGAQGLGGMYIKNIEGNLQTVIGLPLGLVKQVFEIEHII